MYPKAAVRAFQFGPGVHHEGSYHTVKVQRRGALGKGSFAGGAPPICLDARECARNAVTPRGRQARLKKTPVERMGRAHDRISTAERASNALVKPFARAHGRTGTWTGARFCILARATHHRLLCARATVGGGQLLVCRQFDYCA